MWRCVRQDRSSSIGDAEFKEGEQFNGGGFRSIPASRSGARCAPSIRSPATSEWEHKLLHRALGRLLSTAGHLRVSAVRRRPGVRAAGVNGESRFERFQAGGAARFEPPELLGRGPAYIAIAMESTSFYVFFGLE